MILEHGNLAIWRVQEIDTRDEMHVR